MPQRPSAARAARPGLLAKYPEWGTEDEARKKVEVYDKDYHDLLANSDVEAVIIAVPALPGFWPTRVTR